MNAGEFRGTGDTSMNNMLRAQMRRRKRFMRTRPFLKSWWFQRIGILKNPWFISLHLIVCWLNHALCPDSLTPFRDLWG